MKAEFISNGGGPAIGKRPFFGLASRSQIGFNVRGRENPDSDRQATGWGIMYLTKHSPQLVYVGVVAPTGTAGGPASQITPAMVEAGVDRLSRLDLEWDSSEQIVLAVYEAMAAARDDAACPPSSNLQLAQLSVASTRLPPQR